MDHVLHHVESWIKRDQDYFTIDTRGMVQMELIEDKAPGRSEDEGDEPDKPLAIDMQVDGNPKCTAHDKTDEDTESHGTTEATEATEATVEEPCEKSDEPLQKSLLPNKERDPLPSPCRKRRTPGDEAEPMRADSEPEQDDKPNGKRGRKTPGDEAEAMRADSETQNHSAEAVALQTKMAQQQRLEPLTQATIDELLAKEDYAGAAAIQKEMKSIADHDKTTATQTAIKIQELLDKQDYSGAAALQAAAKTRAVETPITMELIQEQRGAVKADYEAKLKSHIDREDYTGAADLKKNMQTLEAEVDKLLTDKDLTGARKLLTSSILTVALAVTGVSSQNEYNTEQTQAQSAAITARSAATAAHTIFADKRNKHETMITQLLAERDYTRLAEYDKQFKEMEADYNSKVQVAETTETMAKSVGVVIGTSTMDSLRDTQVRGTKGQGKRPGQMGSGTVTTCAQLCSTDTPIMDRVTIQCAQVMSIGKVCSLPNRGKNKSASKGKNKGASKGKQPTAKGKGKNNGNDDRQEAVPIYLGQEGYIVCVMVFGSDVQALPRLETLTGRFVDFVSAKARAGQKGVLYYDEHSRMVEREQEHNSVNTPRFEYHVSELSPDMATREFVQSMHVNDFVSIALRITQLEESMTNNTGEPYLSIYGTDMDGTTMGPIRLWRWTTEDGGMELSGTYVLRGLRVVKETSWSYDKETYAPREDGAMTVECNFRTAVEDVSDVEAIAALFP